MYAQTRNLQELPPSTARLSKAKMREAAYNEKEADALLSEAVLHARCAVNGRMVEVRATKPAQVFEQVLAQLCDVVFEKAGYIGAPVEDDSDIRSTLAGNVQAGLDGMDAGNTRALREVEDYLKVAASAPSGYRYGRVSNASTSKGPLAGARSTSQMWWRSLWWSSARRCCLAARRFKLTIAAWWRSCARMPIRPRCACACA